MFSGKNELQASASLISGFNAQTAYSVSDHLGITANGMLFRSSDRKSDHAYGEMGAGYYSNKKKFYFDIIGGYGIGRAQVKDFVDLSNTTYDDVSGPYHKFFIQPSYAIKENKFQYGVAARFSYLDFSNLVATNAGQQTTQTIHNSVFFEPSFVYRFYYKQVYLMGQAGINWLLTNTDGHIGYPYVQFSIGAGIRLNLKKKEKEIKSD